jgi:succinoglycan biosynthesis protein ExoM
MMFPANMCAEGMITGDRRSSGVRVAVCISTFRRQRLLGELLDGLKRLKFEKVVTPQLEVVVVDTPDESGSAEEVCRRASLPWPIKHVVERRRGLTVARNRAVAEAGAVDFIAFIDDDEVPSPQWLDEFLWAQAAFNADIVAGPVSPTYAPEVPQWIRAGEFFASRPHSTGTSCRTCATHNCLVGKHVFAKVPGFDDRFAFSGAEDTDFSLRASEAGCKIVWSQEALVYEYTSAKRGTVGWILLREYQTGNGWIFCTAVVDGSAGSRLLQLLKASAHVVLGLGSAFTSVLCLDSPAVLRALQRASKGAGMLSALAGHKFLAYQNPDINQEQKVIMSGGAG